MSQTESCRLVPKRVLGMSLVDYFCSAVLLAFTVGLLLVLQVGI